MPDGQPQTVETMEIIEFGCALATRSGDLLDSRSFLVQPAFRPTLSEFCIRLTSISQQMLSTAPHFAEVAKSLDEWLGEPLSDFIWCSWGNYDLQHVQADSTKHGVAPRFLSFPHVNLKRLWRRTTGQKKKNGLANALAFHKLAFEGRQHRGIDDARNIVRLLPFMDWALESEIHVPGLSAHT